MKEGGKKYKEMNECSKILKEFFLRTCSCMPQWLSDTLITLLYNALLDDKKREWDSQKNNNSPRLHRVIAMTK